MSEQFKRNLYVQRTPKNVRFIDNIHLAIDWYLEPPNLLHQQYNPEMNYFCELPGTEFFALVIDRNYPASDFILVNSLNKFGKWIMAISSDSTIKEREGGQEKIDALVSLFCDATKFPSINIKPLQNNLFSWRKIPNLSEHLIPPSEELTKKMFQMISQYNLKQKK
ncbi:MAG: hypothetical protein IH994_10555 [Proteobacteria bacterium]|nr:hypothetical protein [Pseudomonadota bacterium]